MHKKVTAFTCSLGLSIALLLSSGSLHAAEKKTSSYWQCVTFARAYTGMQIYGDAWTWWDKASGKYATGHKPEPGSVLAFPSQGRMTRGHVAVVSRIITDRIITVTHANWSPIGGRRGQVEEDVTVVDVSDKGDWSRVKVWYDPLKDTGSTAYKTYGFIYNTKDATPTFGRDRVQVASNETLDGVLNNSATLNDSRPASMKTSVMVRFPARVQTALASTVADADVKKPVSIEAVLANRDETSATAAKKATAKTKLKADTMEPIADAKIRRGDKAAIESVTSPELARKLSGKPEKAELVKASAHSKVSVKKAAVKTSAKVSAKKGKVAKPAAKKTSAKVKAGSLKAKAHKAA